MFRLDRASRCQRSRRSQFRNIYLIELIAAQRRANPSSVGHSMNLRVLILSIVFISALAAQADAHEFRVVAHSDLPVFVGAGVDYEGPYRIRLATSVGIIPKAYVQASNALLVPIFESRGYGEPQADLIESALQNSLVWRTTVGWRPLSDYGFIFGAGYTFMGLGGAATGAQIIAGTTGIQAPAGTGNSNFDVAASVHLLHVEAGWQWELGDYVWLRTGIGWGFSIASATTVDAQTSRNRGISAFETLTENYIDDLFTSYVHPPQITFAIGWQL